MVDNPSTSLLLACSFAPRSELLYHALGCDDHQAVDPLKKRTPERVWHFLDLAEAIQAEAGPKGLAKG
jgi:hypothetical protein